MKWLQLLFPPAVTEPIRLHVEAKRYLWAVDAAYRASLSPNSESSLLLQGGSLSVEEASIFITKPYAKNAVRLRIWDDRTKVEGLKTPNLKNLSLLSKVVYSKTEIHLNDGTAQTEDNGRLKSCFFKFLNRF